MELGDLHSAEKFFEASLAHERDADQHLIATACANLGGLAARAGDLERARSRISSALAIIASLGLQRMDLAGGCLFCSAWIAAAGGQVEDAMRIFVATDRNLTEAGVDLDAFLGDARDRAREAVRTQGSTEFSFDEDAPPPSIEQTIELARKLLS
jgi:hypothetical protein